MGILGHRPLAGKKIYAQSNTLILYTLDLAAFARTESNMCPLTTRMIYRT